ncbi:MAG: hypothetical protein HFE57_07060 [Firmicutes bacterium]|jgi:preprotein translocase subunit SecB|nr:hypothetical protein [Bacillota bacterium]
MQESNFQFKNPILKKINYHLNEDFDRDKFDKIDLKFQTNVIGKKSEKQAIVKLRGEFGESNENFPFYIEIELEAPFKWTEDIPEDVAKNLLKRNAPALLLSYMRPIVAFITSQSGIVPYNIPYIDFTKENEEND